MKIDWNEIFEPKGTWIERKEDFTFIEGYILGLTFAFTVLAITVYVLHH